MAVSPPLKWLAQGYGYEITEADAWAAYENTLRAAQKLGQAGQVRGRIRELVGGDTPAQRWLHMSLLDRLTDRERVEEEGTRA
jgi:hypothetical protein